MKEQIKVWIGGFIIILLSLVGCTTHQPVQGTAIDDMNAAMHQGMLDNKRIDYITSGHRVPAAVSAAMIPDMKVNMPQGKQDDYARRFDIAVRDVPAKAFFMGLVRGTRYSMVISPEVVGVITLNLKQVTIEEVLKTVEEVYGYQYRHTSTGYEVLPNKLETKMFSVNYLDITRKGTSNIQMSPGEITQQALSGSGGGSSSGSGVGTPAPAGGGAGAGAQAIPNSVVTTVDIDFWKQLQINLLAMINNKDGEHSVMVNPQAGLVVARAYPRELKQIARYLSTVENHMDRQVVLEAKILEVTLNNSYQMGIDWRIFGAKLLALDHPFPNTQIDPATFPAAFTASIHWAKGFSTTIQALETQGNVQVLSSPRIATMNNQKAMIKVGSDEFFVTNVQTSTATTINSTIPTESVTLTPFFSGITLDVTPQIDQQGIVTLQIHPTVSKVQDQQKTIDLGATFGTLVLPLAISTIRESDTIVHARNGQVVVLGGLMQNQTQEDVGQLPYFANVPFLGTLFRNTKQGSTKSELVILLRTTIIGKKVWSKELSDSRQKVMSLKEGFHIGGREDLYGSDGERPLIMGPPSGQYRHSASH